MSKENDVEKLKADVETLVNDCKNIFGNLFGNFKETVKEEIDDKKQKLGGQLHQLKDKITEEASKPGTLQYVGAAFIVGIIVGALMTKKKDE